MAGQAAICPKCGHIMSTDVRNTSPQSRRCKCGANVQWWIDRKTGRIQVGIR